MNPNEWVAVQTAIDLIRDYSVEYGDIFASVVERLRQAKIMPKPTLPFPLISRQRFGHCAVTIFNAVFVKSHYLHSEPIQLAAILIHEAVHLAQYDQLRHHFIPNYFLVPGARYELEMEAEKQEILFYAACGMLREKSAVHIASRFVIDNRLQGYRHIEDVAEEIRVAIVQSYVRLEGAKATKAVR